MVAGTIPLERKWAHVHMSIQWKLLTRTIYDNLHLVPMQGSKPIHELDIQNRFLATPSEFAAANPCRTDWDEPNFMAIPHAFAKHACNDSNKNTQTMNDQEPKTAHA